MPSVSLPHTLGLQTDERIKHHNDEIAKVME